MKFEMEIVNHETGEVVEGYVGLTIEELILYTKEEAENSPLNHGILINKTEE
jgi:hypothetical protein